MKASTFLLILFSVTLGAAGQIAMKRGMSLVGFVPLSSLKEILPLCRVFGNPFVMLGLSLYGISAVSWLVVLSRADLSYVYPMISINYILVVFLSRLILHEPLSLNKLMGSLIICLGIWVLSRGG